MYEYYGAPTTPTDDYLAHWGVKGMKWGIRKARETSGNGRVQSREFRRLEKKLAKLNKRATSGGKYARRAAALGAGAALAGGLSIPGVAGKIGNKAASAYTKAAGKYASHVTNGNAYAQKMATDMARGKATKFLNNAHSIGNSTSVATKAANTYGKAAGAYAGHVTAGNAYAKKAASDLARGNAKKAVGGLSNASIARLGGAAVGLGLLGAAGYNAYRAATTKRAAKKAAALRAQMNRQYGGSSSRPKKRRA